MHTDSKLLTPLRLVLVLALTYACTASAEDVSAEQGKKLVAQLQAAMPDLPIEHVYEVPVPGLYGVSLKGGQSIYATSDGQFLLSGDLFQVTANGLNNLAEGRRAIRRKALMQQVPAEDMVVFSPAGETKTHISVFTDVDCSYCRKLHQEMADMNALGIEVRYLAYPRAGLGTPTFDKIVSAWCAEDPNKAITDLKAGRAIASAECENPVAEQYMLGQSVGVTGTPAIVTEDGRLLPGYMPAAALAENLGLE